MSLKIHKNSANIFVKSTTFSKFGEYNNLFENFLQLKFSAKESANIKFVFQRGQNDLRTLETTFEVLC